MSILGGLIGAGTSLLGGLLGANEAKKNRALQKEAMYNGIQIKVKDAEKAGVHPLYALGASTFSPTPIMSGLPEAVGNAGQDISRAVSAAQDGRERASVYSKTLQSLQLERGSLENELLRSQIRKLNAPGSPPVSPGPGDGNVIDGQGDTRAPVSALGVTVRPRASESQAQDLENEYGEVADWVGGVRLARDADAPVSAAVRNYLWTQWEKVRRNEPNDLFTIRGPSWGRSYLPPSWYKTNRGGR